MNDESRPKAAPETPATKSSDSVSTCARSTVPTGSVLGVYLARVPGMSAVQAVDLVKLLVATGVLTQRDVIDEEQRSGDTRRVVTGRATVATCRDCGRSFGSSGAAASHTRSTGDITEVIYTSTFSFVPNDRRHAMPAVTTQATP